MISDQDAVRDLAALPVPLAGALQETGDPWEPYRIIDADGEPVAAVAEFFRDLQAAGRSKATLRSYGHDLLRWFRFLWAVEVPWNRATRIEARDFCRWMLVAGKPSRPHWRSPDGTSAASGEAYAPSVRAHSETVLRCDAIVRALIAAEVAHFDETGFRVAGKLAWAHSASSGKFALVTAHAKRGTAGMDAAGVLPAFAGIACHVGRPTTATTAPPGTPCATRTCSGS